MKLAEEEFVQGADHLNVNRMYMTNSGRIEGDGMLQYDLNALKSFMDDSDNGSFEELWKRVYDSICCVMERFQNYKKRTDVGVQSTICSKKLSSSVPKILGFDYIVDDEKQPWLLEVNRFPGKILNGSSQCLSIYGQNNLTFASFALFQKDWNHEVQLMKQSSDQ